MTSSWATVVSANAVQKATSQPTGQLPETVDARGVRDGAALGNSVVGSGVKSSVTSDALGRAVGVPEPHAAKSAPATSRHALTATLVDKRRTGDCCDVFLTGPGVRINRWRRGGLLDEE
jgi:hypothetical protein